MVNEKAHLSWLIRPFIKGIASWLILRFVSWLLWLVSAVMTDGRVERSISEDSAVALPPLLPKSPVSLLWSGPSLSNSQARELVGLDGDEMGGQFSALKTVSTVIQCEDSNRQCLQVFTQTLLFIGAGPRHAAADCVYLKCNLSEL